MLGFGSPVCSRQLIRCPGKWRAEGRGRGGGEGRAVTDGVSLLSPHCSPCKSKAELPSISWGAQGSGVTGRSPPGAPQATVSPQGGHSSFGRPPRSRVPKPSIPVEPGRGEGVINPRWPLLSTARPGGLRLTGHSWPGQGSGLTGGWLWVWVVGGEREWSRPGAGVWPAAGL